MVKGLTLFPAARTMVKALTNLPPEEPPVNVLVLAGSLRAGSTNRRLAEAAIALLPEGVQARVRQHLAELPFYSEDLDGADLPAVAADFRRAVAEADALVVVTPEYNGSLSGVLKNAIDWASRPRGAAALAGKKVAVLAASGSPRGAQWAREDAIRVLRVAGAEPLEESLGLGTAHEGFAGDRLADAAVEARLRTLLGALVSPRLAA
jgi:NAD(P)H-dependent FMN reductase